MRDLWTTADGLRVYARATLPAPGRERPVVLLHGAVVSGTYMLPTARALAPFCRVLVPDLPGWGRSCKPWPPLRLPALADALDVWLGALGIGRACFVGNSFGCQILVELALRHPQRVEALLLQGMTVDPGVRTAVRQTLALARNAWYEPPMGPIALRDLLSMGVPRSIVVVHEALTDRVEEKLPQVTAPALVVRGAFDPLMSQAWAERAAALLPRGRLALVPHTAHTMNFSAPWRLAHLAREFFALLQDGASA